MIYENWMSVAMLGTKKTATAGIRNSNLAEMAYKNGWKSRYLPSVLYFVTGIERHRERGFITEHLALDMEVAQG